MAVFVVVLGSTRVLESFNHVVYKLYCHYEKVIGQLQKGRVAPLSAEVQNRASLSVVDARETNINANCVPL